jgi:hypothetical protein
MCLYDFMRIVAGYYFTFRDICEYELVSEALMYINRSIHYHNV